MTNDELRMTIAERGADMAAVPTNHRLRQNRYKNVRNSLFQRSSDILGLLLSHLNLLIPVIPLNGAGAADDYRLWVGPQAPTRKLSRTRKNTWSKTVTFLEYIVYGLAGLKNRVPVASEQVPMSHLRVLMSRQPVPVASRQVLIGYELRLATPDARLVEGVKRTGRFPFWRNRRCKIYAKVDNVGFVLSLVGNILTPARPAEA